MHLTYSQLYLFSAMKLGKYLEKKQRDSHLCAIINYDNTVLHIGLKLK